MTPRAIQLTMQVFGSMLGLLGVSVISGGLVTVAKDTSLSAIVSAIISMILGAFFARGAYLVWFRWSPLALRHVVGDFVFFITLFCTFWLPSYMPTGLGPYPAICSLPVCYVGYRMISSGLNRRAFAPLLPPLPSSST